MNARLHDRLAALRVDVAPETAARHLARIRTELQTPPARQPGWRRIVRRLLAVAGLLLALALPAGLGVAAEDSVPGDALFPVKQVTEWLRSWVDDSLAAEHRVDELETLLERDAPRDVVTDQLRRAEDAVAGIDANPPLRDRLDAARDRVGREAGDLTDATPVDTTRPAVLDVPVQTTVPPTTTAPALTDRAPDSPVTTTTTRPASPSTSTTRDRDAPPATDAPPQTEPPRDDPPLDTRPPGDDRSGADRP